MEESRSDVATPATQASEAAAEARPQRVRLALLQSLQYRDFRLLWTGQFGFSGAMWAEAVARNWLAWDMTHSALFLALVNLSRAGPMIITSLFAGVIADRADRKRILLASQAAALILAAIMAALVITDVIRPWHVVLTAGFFGATMAFNQPSRTSLIPDLVPRESVMNAIALNQVAMNVSRVGGPALAGLLIGWFEVSGAYLMEVVLLALVMLVTITMTIPKATPKAKKTTMWDELFEGFSYVRSRKDIVGVLLLTLIPMFLVMPVTTLMPIYADEVLDVGPQGYGLLLTIMGAGALLGGVLMASLSSLPRRGLVLLGSAFCSGAAVAGLGGLQWFAPVVVLLLAAGAAQTVYRTVSNDVLLDITPQAYHGRVMSMYFLDNSFMQFGSVLAGAMTELTDVNLTLAVMGGAAAVLIVFVQRMATPLRRL